MFKFGDRVKVTKQGFYHLVHGTIYDVERHGEIYRYVLELHDASVKGHRSMSFDSSELELLHARTPQSVREE